MSTPRSRRADLLASVARATRQASGQGVLFSQAVAERLGLASTDVECLSVLAESGRLSAGRLAELTGLTTGAATRMIDRLEQAGYVRRVPDPTDRRRVIVEPVTERVARVGAFFESMARASQELAARYSDDDLALIGDYLDRTLEVTRAETMRLQEAVAGGDSSGCSYAAPLGPATSGRLVFLSGAPTVVLRGDPSIGDLYRAQFQGPMPRVRVRGGVVTVRYGRFSWLDWRARVGEIAIDVSMHWRRYRGDITLNASVPWDIELRGGASRLIGDLVAVDLRSLEVTGGAGRVELALPRPRSVVSIRVTGGMSDVMLHRPAGTATRLRVSGGVGRVTLDDRESRGGGEVRLETPGAGSVADRYDIELTGGASRVTVNAR